MKIVLTRRRGLSSQDAKSYMQVVFAHISDKIRITSVNVKDKNKPSSLFGKVPEVNDPFLGLGSEPETITVECMPQGSTIVDAALVDLVKEAIKLRGDLELEEIATKYTFPNANKSPSANEEQNVPKVFLPWHSNTNFFQQQNHFQQHPPQPLLLVKVPGIRQVALNAFKVDENFASFVARDKNYLNKLMMTTIVEVFVIYEKLNERTLRFTGNLESQRLTNSNPESRTIYQLFANAVNSNSNLCSKLSQANVDTVGFMLANGELIAEITTTEQIATKLGLSNNATKTDKDGSTKQPDHTSSLRP